MKIISRYILAEFLQPLLFIVAAFVGLYVIAQLVDEMRMFVSHHPPLSQIILYYTFRIPYFIIQVMPLSVLLAALLSLGQLARQNELIALRSCGISFRQVAMPILLAAVGIAAFVLIFDEIVIPITNPRAEYIKKVNIERKDDEAYYFRREHITRSLAGQRIIYIKRFDALAGKMEDVIYFEMDANMNILRRLDAPYAHWVSPFWIFENGVERTFGPGGEIIALDAFKKIELNLKESPREFINEEKDAQQLLSMPARELQKRIRTLKEAGINPNKEEVNFHLKFSFPFANVILALLGISLPFIFPSGRRALVGAAIGFVITLVTGFFYIGFIAIGTSLGNNGTLSPVLSVWLANIVFGTLGLWLIRQART